MIDIVIYSSPTNGSAPVEKSLKRVRADKVDTRLVGRQLLETFVCISARHRRYHCVVTFWLELHLNALVRRDLDILFRFLRALIELSDHFVDVVAPSQRWGFRCVRIKRRAYPNARDMHVVASGDLVPARQLGRLTDAQKNIDVAWLVLIAVDETTEDERSVDPPLCDYMFKLILEQPNEIAAMLRQAIPG